MLVTSSFRRTRQDVTIVAGMRAFVFVCRTCALVFAILQRRVGKTVFNGAYRGSTSPFWLLAIPLQIDFDAFDRIGLV
jgi:hypothetical protein